MRDIYVNFSVKPRTCYTCGKQIRTGGRVVTDGKHDFDTCQCADQADDNA